MQIKTTEYHMSTLLQIVKNAGAGKLQITYNRTVQQSMASKDKI